MKCITRFSSEKELVIGQLEGSPVPKEGGEEGVLPWDPHLILPEDW